jgi:hypothetical protein
MNKPCSAKYGRKHRSIFEEGLSMNLHHFFETDASRQAERDSSSIEDEEGLALTPKQIKREAQHKAADYARRMRSAWAASYVRAYKRNRKLEQRKDPPHVWQKTWD